MDRSIISRIEEWDSRPAPGGYVGLNELADGEFTGAVTAGGAYLFMLNGRVVGISGGGITAFEGAEVTAYEAPDPALPLLFSMQKQGGDVRGKYYTDDTSIQEVDETLTSSGFTGYLELSENVLSGDYYVVYYGGRSLSAAFVGNEGRTVTGDEAFELAADEVGIYEVTSVDLEVIDVPEPAADAAATAGGDVASSQESGDATETDDDEGADAPDGTEGDEPVEEPAPTPEPDAADDDVPDEAEATTGAAETGSAGTEPEAVDAEAGDGDDTAERATNASDTEPIEEAEPAEAGSSTDVAGETSDQRPEDTEPAATPEAGQPHAPQEQELTDPDERFEEEARWREAATVPALDPDESAPPEADLSPKTESESDEPPSSDRAETVSAEEVAAHRQRIGQLETQLEESERERRRLSEQLEAARSDRDELTEEREALEDRIEALEAQLEDARSADPSEDPVGQPASTSQSETGRSVDPETALDQTDLFVRYGSKAEATLESAHAGRAGFDEVAENLRIETHSRFDTNTATVEGRPFTEYLEGTIQYRFVTWLVEDLLYEIQETGTESGLRDLYDVLPALDRAEFNGSVTSYDQEGEEVTESFDVVCRDRMGKPLIVANLNDSLDPASGDMMATLVEDGTNAAEAHESMGAAFLVTASFFKPEALETAAEATRGGGFLSRDSKKSFVKLARNGGYHLCLVEARGDDFHVAVPEF